MNNLLYFLFFPEIFLTFGILVTLLISVFLKESYKFSLFSSNFLIIIVSFMVFMSSENTYLNFNSFFENNFFIKIFKILILIGSLICLSISENYLKDNNLEIFEIPILILFSILGMMIMVSSNNLISIYLGLELQSLSLYILATINKNSLKSSEAGLKYFVLGSLSSGILLYGCSLIYGFTGNLNYEIIFNLLKNHSNLSIGLIFGLVFVITGLLFKVSAVPFHMWTPDVYEGSPTSFTAFFSIVSKVAAIGLLIRFLMIPFNDFVLDWQQIIIFVSIASMIVGSLAAIKQTNFKRLLAYSSIGHMGYLLIGLATGSQEGIQAIIIYLIFYIFMNSTLFAILLSIKNKEQYIESIDNFSGLNKKNPIISIIITIMMFSMAGIPPFAGFFGKFYIFLSALNSDLYFLAIIGVISSVIAAFYYLKIIKTIYFNEPTINHEILLTFKSKIIILISTVVITFFIIFPTYIVNISNTAVKFL